MCGASAQHLICGLSPQHLICGKSAQHLIHGKSAQHLHFFGLQGHESRHGSWVSKQVMVVQATCKRSASSMRKEPIWPELAMSKQIRSLVVVNVGTMSITGELLQNKPNLATGPTHCELVNVGTVFISGELLHNKPNLATGPAHCELVNVGTMSVSCTQAEAEKQSCMLSHLLNHRHNHEWTLWGVMPSM